MLPRENVAAALFALTTPLAQASGGIFVTLSRRIVPAPQVGPAQCPALYQIQDNESIREDSRTLSGLYVTDFRLAWVVYTNAANPPEASSPVLNDAVDAALSVLPPAGSALNLEVNGVLCTIYWTGSLNYFEGIIQGKSVAEIPIIVRVPWATPAQ